MGRTTEKVTIQNFGDILKVAEGVLDESEIRTVEVDAVVDTGATYLCLPPSVIDELGLLYSHTRTIRTANDDAERRVFHGAVATILGRTEDVSVMENDKSTPPLVGCLLLEGLDFVVCPRSGRLIPNPEHDEKRMAECY